VAPTAAQARSRFQPLRIAPSLSNLGRQIETTLMLLPYFAPPRRSVLSLSRQVSIVILTSADTRLRRSCSSHLISAFCGFMALASVLRALMRRPIHYVQDFHRRYADATQVSGGGKAQRSLGR